MCKHNIKQKYYFHFLDVLNSKSLSIIMRFFIIFLHVFVAACNRTVQDFATFPCFCGPHLPNNYVTYCGHELVGDQCALQSVYYCINGPNGRATYVSYCGSACVRSDLNERNSSFAECIHSANFARGTYYSSKAIEM